MRTRAWSARNPDRFRMHRMAHECRSRPAHRRECANMPRPASGGWLLESKSEVSESDRKDAPRGGQKNASTMSEFIDAQSVREYLLDLQQRIVASFEELDGAPFRSDRWEKPADAVLGGG